MEILCWLISVYWLILLLRIVMSWFPIDPGGGAAGIYRVLLALTDPVLLPFRGLLPPVNLGGVALDISVFIPFLILVILRAILC